MEDFVGFCRGVDVLIHDAQYVEDDMPQKYGWGHSLVSQVRELALAAEVKHLVLFHHDPERTDEEMDAIEADVRTWMESKRPSTACTAAFEGLVLDL